MKIRISQILKKNVRFVLFLIVIFNIINHWRDYLDPVHWYSFIFHHCTIPLILQFAIFSLFAYLLIKFERFIKQCVWSIFPKSKLGHLINDDGMQKNTRNETPPQKTTYYCVETRCGLCKENFKKMINVLFLSWKWFSFPLLHNSNMNLLRKQFIRCL